MTTPDRREIFDRMASQLYVAVISDILDSLGFRDQVLESNIQPIDPLDRRVLVGSAHTILMAPIYEMKPEPYTRIIAAIDALQPGTVGVVATSGLANAAYWGELFSNAASRRRMMKRNHEYYRSYLKPEALIERTLDIGLAQARGRPARTAGD